MARLRRLLHDRPRYPALAPIRALHRSVVRTQLALVALVDAWRGRRDREPEWLSRRLTITAKTFERPATATRMVRSARRVFSGRIVLADDSRTPMAPPDESTVVVALPFNSGVPRGRNAALAHVETPYTLVTDDDVVLTKSADLVGVVGYLDAKPDVDAVCARLIELPRWYVVGYAQENELFPGALPPRRQAGELIGGLPVVLRGPQVFVARTEALRSVPYDENIRMVDHRDFFSMASGRLVFVHDPDFVVFHARTPFDPLYTKYRNDVAADLAYLARKWSRPMHPGSWF
jgi:hypothetical protein